MNKVIQLKEVHKVYITGEVEVRAVRGVTLDICEGEFVALMGASGSSQPSPEASKSQASAISGPPLSSRRKPGFSTTICARSRRAVRERIRSRMALEPGS